MSQARTDRLHRIARVLGLAALMWPLVAGLGCGGALTSSRSIHADSDPLGLGVAPGPQGSTTPQTIQVRLGSEPSDRVVSLSLTLNSLQATNSGAENLDLLTNPITVELTHSAIVTEPISTRDIYQDTYSGLVFPDMAGQIVFYDVNGQLVSQSLSVPAQTVPYTFVLGDDAMVLNISLDLAQSFTITDSGSAAGLHRRMARSAGEGSSSVVVNPLVVTAQNAKPNPTVGQPESGSISFVVGTVTRVDTSSQTISIQPTSGDSTQMSYDTAGGTEFVNCNPSTLTGMIVEAEGATQANGSVLASEVEMIGNNESSSELYGVLSGYAPEGLYYNLVTEGGVGVNVTTNLIGKNISLDPTGTSYSVNGYRVDLSTSGDLVFDDTRAFPGQLVEVEWDTLVVPDPQSTNAGFMQPGMVELEEQTLSGQVLGYGYDPALGLYTFTLNLTANASLRRMNPGLTTITVRRTPQTFLRNNPTFNDGDSVKVRGLLFADPNCNSNNYQPGNPVAFILVADRISK